MSLLPPVPTRQPVLNVDGTMSRPWVLWAQQVSQRVGGANADTNSELGDQNTDLSTRVSTTETDVTELQLQTASIQQAATSALVAALVGDSPRPTLQYSAVQDLFLLLS